MKKYNKYNSSIKLNEWSYAPSPSLNEDGNDPNGMDGAPDDDMGGAPGGAPGGQDPNGMDGAPGSDMGGAPGGAPGGQDPNGMNGAPGSDMGMEGQDPSMGMDDPNAMEDSENEEPTDELSVDDLTDAQEKLNKKMNSIGKDFGDTKGQMNQMMSAIDKLNSIINANNEKIADLKKEIERRNPTPVEKLELRSVKDSYPFNIKPTDYWEDKTKDSNYEVGPDNEKEYTITDDDLDNIDDSEIAKTFDDYDDYKKGTSLSKIFGY